MKLWDRSTGDLLVLMIAGTICFTVLAAGAAVTVLELRDPDYDTSKAVAGIRDVLGTLIGLLAGYLAGKARSNTESHDER